MRFRSLFACFSLCVAAISAHACTITLDTLNSTSSVYQYNVNEPGSSNVSLPQGETITITGLSGVTGAGVNSTYQQYLTASYTANSVTYTLTSAITIPANSSYADVFYINANPQTTKSGNATYAYSNSTYTGTTQGPVANVAPAPEPSSLALLGTGLLGVAGAVRRRYL